MWGVWIVGGGGGVGDEDDDGDNDDACGDANGGGVGDIDDGGGSGNGADSDACNGGSISGIDAICNDGGGGGGIVIAIVVVVVGVIFVDLDSLFKCSQNAVKLLKSIGLIISISF